MTASPNTRLFEQDRAARLLLYAATGAGFVAGAMLVAQAWLLSLVVDRVFLGSQSLSQVLPLIVLMVGMLAVRSGCLYIEAVLAQRAAGRTKQRLRQAVIEQLARLGPTYLRATRTGELVSTVTDSVDALDAYLTQFLPARYLAVLSPVFTLLVVILLDAWTALVLLFAAPMLLLMLALIGGRAKALTERRVRELSWMSALFLDLLQGLTTLKLFGRSKEQADTIERVSRQFGKTTMEVLTTTFQSSLVMEWAATAATALVALEVSYRLMAGALNFPIALAVLLLTPEFFLPLRTLAVRYHAGAAGKAAVERIAGLLNMAFELKTPAIPAIHDPVSARLPAIRFEQVTYAYEGASRSALVNASFTLGAGRRIALVGATGAGKSTIAGLLLRIAEPQTGAILVGETPLAHFDPDAWRSHVAWAPQHPHLFQGTVLDNLRMARPDASMEQIVDAACAAGAHEFIRNLPAGYATPIGERGARLSGGQRQRISLARAFLRAAPLLILDEATAYLDAESERIVLETLDHMRACRTVLLIAHRMEVARTADDVIVLREGCVVDAGAPHELLARPGYYRELNASYGAVP